MLLRALTVAHVAGHLLVLEDLARVLAVTRRTVRAVRDGHAVCRAQTAEVPALHHARKALALGVPGDVDILTSDKVIGRKLGSDVETRLFGHTELYDDLLWPHFGFREMAAPGPRNVLCLGRARGHRN